jgi:hypothetical protein
MVAISGEPGLRTATGVAGLGAQLEAEHITDVHRLGVVVVSGGRRRCIEMGVIIPGRGERRKQG